MTIERTVAIPAAGPRLADRARLGTPNPADTGPRPAEDTEAARAALPAPRAPWG